MRLGASGCAGTIWGVQGWLRVLPQELATLAVFRLHLGLLPRAGDGKTTVPGQCWGGGGLWGLAMLSRDRCVLLQNPTGRWG